MISFSPNQDYVIGRIHNEMTMERQKKRVQDCTEKSSGVAVEKGNENCTQFTRGPCSSLLGSFPEMISSNIIPKLYTFVSGSESGGSSECSESFSPEIFDLEEAPVPKLISAI